jgi:Putative bacterial sensory transduction regulator
VEIEPLSPQLIERYLKGRDLRFYRSHDGDDFLVLFTTKHGKLHANLRLCGSGKEVLVISVSPAAYFPAEERVRLMEVVNNWNRDTWWPKAFLQETSRPDQVGVFGEYSVYLPKGIHFDGLVELIGCTTACAGDLFDKIAAAMRLPSTQTLEGWLDRTG